MSACLVGQWARGTLCPALLSQLGCPALGQKCGVGWGLPPLPWAARHARAVLGAAPVPTVHGQQAGRLSGEAHIGESGISQPPPRLPPKSSLGRGREQGGQRGSGGPCGGQAVPSAGLGGRTSCRFTVATTTRWGRPLRAGRGERARQAQFWWPGYRRDSGVESCSGQPWAGPRYRLGPGETSQWPP